METRQNCLVSSTWRCKHNCRQNKDSFVWSPMVFTPPTQQDKTRQFCLVRVGGVNKPLHCIVSWRLPGLEAEVRRYGTVCHSGGTFVAGSKPYRPFFSETYHAGVSQTEPLRITTNTLFFLFLTQNALETFCRPESAGEAHSASQTS